jgi:inner membrane protein
MNIQGGREFSMVPVGENSVFSLSGDWNAPSFQGSYLPMEQSVGENGFKARWEVSHLSRNIPLYWADIIKEENAYSSSSKFGVKFFKPLDHYDVNTRAVKYGILFIIIPFLSLYLFELLARRDIHPVQYLLSGAGNVLFYLLLLSFSEHISFGLSYSISALAVILMLSCYSRSFLGIWKRSGFLALIMGLCYTFFYFTLQSEDWALLIGSIGIFAITGLVMFLTRKFDWYGRNSQEPSYQMGRNPKLPRESGFLVPLRNSPQKEEKNGE